MALLSDTDPDPTPRSTLRCDSTVGDYKHSDLEKKGKKERREIKDGTRSEFHLNNQYSTPMAEWSEQLRAVTSVRLGAVRRRLQIRLCTEQRV